MRTTAKMIEQVLGRQQIGNPSGQKLKSDDHKCDLCSNLMTYIPLFLT